MELKEDRYSAFRQVKQSIDAIRKEATKQFKGEFSEDEAHRVGALFQDYTQKVLGATPQLEHVVLTATGADVEAPNITAGMDDNTLSFAINGEEAHRTAGNLVSFEGHFSSVLVERINSSDDEVVKLGANLYIEQVYPDLNVPCNDRPFMRLRRTDYIRMPLDVRRDAEIGVKQLEVLREKKDAVTALCARGLAGSSYIKKLHALDEALIHETNEFIELKNISILHDIGRTGFRHAKRSSGHEDAVADSLLKTLGRGRSLRVEAETIYTPATLGEVKLQSGVIAGKVVGICSDLYGVEADSLMVVLHTAVSKDELEYVPLDKINGLWF